MSAIFVAVEHPADLLSGEVNNLGEKGRVCPDTVTTLEQWIQWDRLHQLEHWMNTVDLHSNLFLKLNVHSFRQSKWLEWPAGLGPLCAQIVEPGLSLEGQITQTSQNEFNPGHAVSPTALKTTLSMCLCVIGKYSWGLKSNVFLRQAEKAGNAASDQLFDPAF